MIGPISVALILAGCTGDSGGGMGDGAETAETGGTTQTSTPTSTTTSSTSATATTSDPDTSGGSTGATTSSGDDCGPPDDMSCTPLDYEKLVYAKDGYWCGSTTEGPFGCENGTRVLTSPEDWQAFLATCAEPVDVPEIAGYDFAKPLVLVHHTDSWFGLLSIYGLWACDDGLHFASRESEYGCTSDIAQTIAVVVDEAPEHLHECHLDTCSLDCTG